MAYQFLTTKRDGPVEHLVLNRPDVRNAFNAKMIGELTAWAGAFARQSDARVVVLSGAGRVFCAGADATWMAETVSYSEAENLRDAGTASAMFRALDELPVPLVGRIHGAAIGGGAELVAYGDLVVATPRARFALPEITIGMFPPLASTMFPHIVGPKRALELILTGEAISAERARDLGLVNRLVPEAQLQAAVNELIVKITAQSGAVLGMAKKAVLAGMGMSLRDSLRHSMSIFLNELYRLEDSQEGLRALLEKRKPQWKNR